LSDIVLYSFYCHVKPCASFDLSKESDIIECFCWKNVRPCLANENYSKKDKIIPYQIEMQEFKANYFESTYPKDL